MTGTAPSVLPPKVKKPVRRRVAEIGANPAPGLPGDETGLLPELLHFVSIQGGAEPFRSDSGAPENFIRHPVANSRKAVLKKQGWLNGQAGVALEKLCDEGQC